MLNGQQFTVFKIQTFHELAVCDFIRKKNN